MNPHQFAKELDGAEYGNEGNRALWARMKAAGIVAVFGSSDDLMEFRGAIDDEIGCYDGGLAYLTPKGILKNKCEDDACPYHRKEQEAAAVIEAKFGNDGFSWTYDTAIPHHTFIVKEEGENYCRGIVFALSEVPA